MSADTPDPETRIYDTVEAGEKIVIVDMFCGAGGMSTGAKRVLDRIATQFDKPLAEVVELIAVNHWDTAIESHSENYPWATHFHRDVTALSPWDLINHERSPLDEDSTIDLFIACPDCTYFSSARGGGPKDPDSRMLPWEVIEFVEKLTVQNFLFENVPEFRNWGPLDENNEPITEQKGEYFDNWLSTLAVEFNVEHRVLNAADYGDATSRRRLFIIGRKNAGVAWPSPTHSEDGSELGTDRWRTAADILDLSDQGESIWVRDLRDGRRSPLVNNTMKRIAEGVRKHGDERITPYAAVLEDICQEDVKSLRNTIVPVEAAPTVAEAIDRPFLVAFTDTFSDTVGPSTELSHHQEPALDGGQYPPFVLSQHSNSVTRTINERPTPTVCPGGKTSLVDPRTYVLGQQSAAVAKSAVDNPLPTVASRGAISLFTSAPFVLPKNGKQRGLFSNPSYQLDEQPLHTIVAGRRDQGYMVAPNGVRLPGLETANRTSAGFTEGSVHRDTPFIMEYYGNGQTHTLDQPIPTIPTRDRFALVVPELYPVGINILFRMLKPDELAAAMGFPSDYSLTGNKKQVVKQIGNAVPVNLAESLCEAALMGYSPTIESFTDGVQGGAVSDD